MFGRRAATSLLAAAALAPALLMTTISPVSAAGTATEVLSADTLPGIAGLASTQTAPTTTVRVGITLANPNAAAQSAAYRAVYTPGSPQYHHFMSAEQVADEFGVPATTFSALESWATRDGLTAASAPATHEYLLLAGSAAQAEATFSVTLRDYTRGGTKFFANANPPTVPAGLGINGVIGLNSLLKSHTFNQKPPASARHGSGPAQGTCDPTGTACTGLTTPQDLWSIYGQPTNLADPTQDFGQGQQMAVLGEGAVAGPLGDLRAFEAENKLPQVPITIHSAGDKFTDTSGSPEWDIDSQASTGMSPKVSGETWYFANDLTDASVLADIQDWETDPKGPLQANASFGECEEDPTSPVTGGGASTPVGGAAGTAGVMFTAGTENALQQATLQGKTLFSSTGDTGSSCPVVFAAVIGAGNGVANQAYPETNYPASSAYVVAVGGTVLYSTPSTATAPASNAARADEYSWNFTGGGNTFYIAEPKYQQGIAMLDNQPCVSDPTGTPYATQPQPCRGIPDVAAQSGDIATNGYAVTIGGANDSAGGGTSLSSPLWMGMWTRIQAAASTKNAAGQFTNGFADPALYKVGLDATKDANDFFDIGSGPPTSQPNSNGYYTSLPRSPLDPSGWDYLSGLGAPNVTALCKDVTASACAPTNVVAIPPVQDCGQPGLVACAAGGASCTSPLILWVNPPHTATDLLGNSDPQLSLLQGGMSLSIDGTKLRALLTVTNLQEAVPLGAGAAEWYAIWAYGGTTYFANAELSAVPGSTPTFADGTITQTGSSKQFNNANSNDTGNFTLGPNGVVEIDVPLANIGKPPLNADFGNPAGQTNILVGAAGTGSLPTVDTGGPKCDYTLGAAAPAATVPDAPFAPLLVVVALLGAGAYGYRRRRLGISRGGEAA
jgi:subtilase family serine protease